MSDYILVAENESDDPVELPLEDDGTLLLTTVDAQFPGASGIKFINPKTGSPRGVRLADGKFHPPEKDGWGDYTFYCVFPKAADNKRKIDYMCDEEDQPSSKSARLTPKCTDLIVLGLPWETTEEGLRKYFTDNFGEPVMVQVKMTRAGKSRGFGFVRFDDYEVQKKALKARHQIDGRWCDVSLPPSAKTGSSKVFVGRLTSAITAKDLKDYFSTMGDVTDCFIPKPFRGFGFVQFLDPEVAKLACSMQEHTIGDVRVNVETAAPKPSQSGSSDRGTRSRGGGGGGSGRGGYDDEDWGGGYSTGREDRGRSSWSQSYGGRDQSYGGRESGYGESSSRGGLDLRGVSPTRLISALKDAGLADALGGVMKSGYGSSRGGYATHRMDNDNGYRAYNSRSSPDAPAAPTWSRYDR